MPPQPRVLHSAPKADKPSDHTLRDCPRGLEVGLHWWERGLRRFAIRWALHNLQTRGCL